jgi:hypothetical protein
MLKGYLVDQDFQGNREMVDNRHFHQELPDYLDYLD